MTKILRSNESNNPASSTVTEAQFQSQMAAQIDALRQVVGNADINASGTITNPLNSPYTLYVDPLIGSDDWEGGSYNTNASSRIDNQRLACGYSPQRPFRTLNRAVIEAAILTSKSYLSAVGDLVTIFCAPGEHTLLNGAGDANESAIAAWGTSRSDTKNAAWNALLTRFNDPNWGLILPRGVTICGWDLRKTVIRPAEVPSASGTTRRRMLRVTSDCYFFGFSFKDSSSVTTSHHNLACFGFAGQTALDLFYKKIRTAFPNATSSSNLDDTKAVSQAKEYQIVGLMPDPATSSSDTTNGSSPYVFNCSLRSQYGLSGIDLDGSLVDGLKSLVTAQFTNVSLQKDMAAFQKHNGSSWVSVSDYADYINTDINNLRFKVDDSNDYRHFALRCSNGAFMQAVSIFAIGNAVHHWCESGGEITLTNSNSNFGALASLSVGFRGIGKTGGAFAQDTNFTTAFIRRAKTIPTDGSNIRRIFLGTVSSITTTQITLTTALDYQGLLVKNQYSLKSGDYIWIENNNTDVLDGADFRAQLASSPWSSGSPTRITVQDNGNSNFGSTGVANAAVGNRVYVRRLIDSRSPEERETGIIVQNSTTHRRPQGSYVIRLDRDGNLTSTVGSNQLDPANGGGEVFLVGDSVRVTTQKTGTTFPAASYKVLVVSGDSQRLFSTTAGSNYYRVAEVVVYNNRYYRCKEAHTATNFDATKWVETLSNIPVSSGAGGIEAARSNVAPQIILDGDTDSSEASTTLGWTLSATGDQIYVNQLRTAADYRALRDLMAKLGYASGTASTQIDGILHPVAEASRDYQIAGGATPSGKLTSAAAWPLEFNRPSIVRAYGLAYEWVGYGNYSKSLPKYQVFRLNDQQGLDVLAANIGGGRCFNQGTTEEGLVVNPFSIQDLGTGRNYSVDTAGLGGISGDVEYPTEFRDLTVTNTLTVSGALNAPAATTSRDGLGQIASTTELAGATQRTTDSALNSAGARFVTPEGLEYWKAQRGLLSQRSDTTTFYIVPDNAVNGGTYVFDGTSATLTADPKRSITAIAETPPVTREKAICLSNAVAYANQNFTPLENVTYRLAKGPYYTGVPAFNHIANIYGDVAKFPERITMPDFLASDATTRLARPGGGSTSTVKELLDNFQIPCFATVLRPEVTESTKRVNFIAYPVTLTLNYGGTIQGVAWKSVTDTLRDSTNYPNSIYSTLMAAQRSSNQTVGAAMAGYINNDSTILSTYLFDYFLSQHTIIAGSGSLNILDCIFGAKASGTGSIGNGTMGAIVYAKGSCSINMTGIYLLGNTIVTSLPGLTKSLSSFGYANIYGIRNSQHLVSSREGSSSAKDMSLTFNYREGSNQNGVAFDRDTYRNCIHVLDNEGRYALLANRADTSGLRGASFVSLIGELAPGSRFYTGGYDSYQSSFYTNTNKHHGIAGAFGNSSSITSASQNGSTDSSFSGPKGIDGDLAPLSFYRYASYHPSLWQQARTGTQVTHNVTSVTYGAGKQVNAYTNSYDNPLNIASSIFFRGIDTETAQVVGGALHTVIVAGTYRSVFYG